MFFSIYHIVLYTIFFFAVVMQAGSLNVRRATMYIIFIFIVLFVGFREDVGYDYETYYSNWFLFLNSLEDILFFKKEPILPLIFFFLKKISFGYNWSLLTIAAISIWLKIKFISKYSPFILISLILFVGDFLLNQEMGQIRSSLAIGVVALSIESLHKKNLSSFLFIVTIASMIHISASVFYLLYPLIRFNMHMKPYFWGVLFIFSIILSSFNFFEKIINYIVFSFFSIGYSEYVLNVIDGQKSRFFITFGIFYQASTLFFCYRYRGRLVKKVPYLYVFMSMLTLSLILGISMSDIPGISGRFTRVLGISILVLFPALVYIFRDKVVGFVVIALSALIYALLKINMILLSQGAQFIPYKSFLF
jgi:hypothetical protein